MYGINDETAMDEMDHGETALDEGRIHEIAAELVGLGSEREMDGLIDEVLMEVGGEAPARAPARQQLGAIGRFLWRGPVGKTGAPRGGEALKAIASAIRTAASAAGPAQAEIEAAKTFVRLASEAGRALATAPVAANPVAAASQAIRRAAERIGLARSRSIAPGARAIGRIGVAGRGGLPFTESEVEAHANELLTVLNSAELDGFLGDLVSNAWQGVKNAVTSPTAQAVFGGLKNVAATALPVVGGLVGNIVAPGVGGVVGGLLGKGAGALLSNAEVEGEVDQEALLDAAKQFVRLAGAATRHAGEMPPSIPPHAAAGAALRRAARAHAPLFLPYVSGHPQPGCLCHPAIERRYEKLGKTPDLGPVDTFANIGGLTGTWRRTGSRITIQNG